MIRVTYHGHACFSLESEEVKLLTDPFVSENPLAVIDPESLHPDYILLSHGHVDHVGDAVEIARHCGAAVIAPFELAQFCLRRGVEKVIPMNIGGSHRESSFVVKMTIAHHSSAYVADAEIIYTGSPCGYLIAMEEKTIYFAGDTALFHDLQLIAEQPVRLALLPIGDRFTMGPDDARRAVEMLQPDLVVPMHYNTWEMIEQDAEHFAASLAGLGCRGIVLAIEESLMLP
jgi:L-ascorbate metabolism protein UlaG (beta-lactamase superfamily)